MLPWRLARAFAVAGGLLAIALALLSTRAPLAWDAASWSRALPIPLGLLAAAAVGMRARAGPRPGGRVAWVALVAGVATLAIASLSNLAPALSALGFAVAPAGYVAAAGAFAVGVIAGARRALPRPASVALLLAPALMLVPAQVLGALPGCALGLGIVFVVVGTATID